MFLHLKLVHCFSGGNGGSDSGGASGGSIYIEAEVAHIGGKNFYSKQGGCFFLEKHRNH